MLLFVRGKTLPKVDVPEFTRVRCPACGWQPEKSSTWWCSPGCGHTWNTFDTGGICPGCNKHWQRTACLKCGTWSPHDDWYERAQG